MKLSSTKSNFFLCILTFILMPICLEAQDVKHFKYQGEVDMSYSFGMNDETNNVNFEIINGIRFTRYFYAGVGFGASTNFSDEAILIPIYVDLKGYMPVSSSLDLTAGVDIGTKLDFFYGTTGGLLFRPEFGLHFPMKRSVGIKLTMFYELYSYRTTVLNAEISSKTNQIGLRFGINF